MSRYNESLAFLENRVNYETFQSIPYSELKQRLKRLRQIFDSLGSPDSQYPVIHVAGTKGKGTTCIMLDHVLQSCGYKTGCFTSPHLHSLMERFSINGIPCSEDRFAELMSEIRDVVVSWEKNGNLLTYFELTTLFAMLYFAREKVDIAVLEVGLGGRFDSTNVCRPMITVITSISFDHVEQLGPTLADIAFEKSGIIKSGIPIISGVSAKNKEAAQVIDRIANERSAPLLNGDTVWKQFSPVIPQLAVLGEHQRQNAALVLAVLDLLKKNGWTLPDSTVTKALSEVRLPGRIEVLRQNPTLILDGAHNRASMNALVTTVQQEFSKSKRSVLFCSMYGKDIPGMLAELFPHFERIVLTELPNSPRCIPAQELHQRVIAFDDPEKTVQDCVIDIQPDWKTAITHLLKTVTPDDLVCVTGSFYLVAQVRAWFLNMTNVTDMS